MRTSVMRNPSLWIMGGHSTPVVGTTGCGFSRSASLFFRKRSESDRLTAMTWRGVVDRMVSVDILTVWGVCSDCGYEGMLEYRHVAGEDYNDPDALGVMLLQYCPACEGSDNALLPLEFYHEIVAVAQGGGDDGSA